MEGSGAGGKPLVQTPDDLRAHFGQVSPLAEKKVLTYLDKFCRDFIALSPFLVIDATDWTCLSLSPLLTSLFLNFTFPLYKIPLLITVFVFYSLF